MHPTVATWACTCIQPYVWLSYYTNMHFWHTWHCRCREFKGLLYSKVFSVNQHCIASGLKSCVFTEIAPCTFYPLYGTALVLWYIPIPLGLITCAHCIEFSVANILFWAPQFSIHDQSSDLQYCKCLQHWRHHSM